MSTIPFVQFVYPDDSSIFDNSCPSCTQEPEYANYQQLETDANAALASRYQAVLDNAQWQRLSNEIGNLVFIADSANITANQKSLIYGQIMIIITAQYLPVVSDFLGDQIAEQAATENLASDVSAFIISAQTGFNAISSSSTSTQVEQQSLFNGVMALIGNAGALTGVTSAPYSPDYDFNFNVVYQTFDTSTQSFVTNTSAETSVLSFLTDTSIWGSSSSAPLSSSASSQIDTALVDIANNFNGGIILGSNFNPADPNATPTVTPDAPSYQNSWAGGELSEFSVVAQDWQIPYGASSYAPNNSYGPQDAPLVYTEPNKIQGDFNQASQAVETVSNSTQTVENFQIQEIDQFYGIINSIQQSQQSQCAAIVRKQGAG